MRLLNQVRHKLVNHLWNNYVNEVKQAKILNNILLKEKKQVLLDHFAVIDLPSKHTGINTLCQIFSSLGFLVQGRDYLPDKQNEFLWLAEYDAYSKPAQHTLPQVVVADFRLDALPLQVRKVVEKYTSQIKNSPLVTIQCLAGQTYLGNVDAAKKLLTLLLTYFVGREWELPTLADFKLIQEANELLAWVLLFGRKPNHFTIAVHLLSEFKNLVEFHEFINSKNEFPLNMKGGAIKGNQLVGLEQSSTMGELINIRLSDGNILIPDRFIEFIWRYLKNDLQEGVMWDDFYTGFIAGNANRVIESLYETIPQH